MDAGDYSYAIDYLRWQIADRMSEHKVVGLSIVLIDDQKTLWAEGFVLVDREMNWAASDGGSPRKARY